MAQQVSGRQPRYKRILLKLSGEALMGSEEFGIDPKVLDRMALEVGQLVGIGVQVGVRPQVGVHPDTLRAPAPYPGRVTLRLLEFVVAGNEASDLLPVRSPALLRAHGARRGFWTVLDEGPVERCLALLLERVDGEWVAHHVAADAGPENGRTEDGERPRRGEGRPVS